MGTYLSTPVTDKNEESGKSLECPVVPLSWAVVDMQGWRKSMEDAHVAQTDVALPSASQGSGVRHDAKVFGVFDGHGGPEVARFCQLYFTSVLTQQSQWTAEEEPQEHQPELEDEPENDAGLPGSSPTRVGQALISTFHALDRMIGDAARRDELIRLRTVKLLPGERRNAEYIPPEPADFAASGGPATASASSPAIDSAEGTTGEISRTSATTPPLSSSGENDPVSSPGPACKDSTDEPYPSGDSDEKSDDDSDEAVGHNELDEADRDMMTENSTEEDAPAAEMDTADALAGKVSVMFQRLLNMSTPSGQVVVEVNNVPRDNSAAAPAGLSASPSNRSDSGPSASLPSLVRNGRLICNLPDHPIHAGATAIVAVVVGKTITVANAGDSRAVLCRGGDAYPLSFDHKPLQERELTRIRQAGGFVNHFGRVNGNLNLSRSIGDLKYKQVPNIPPAAQMITAEPDIIQVQLTDIDEFIILGCDGIWDCLTNEKAIEYVRHRIDLKTPSEIGVEMLNDIISEDPRSTQGIGGDNMTIMIIDLKPHSRSYR